MARPISVAALRSLVLLAVLACSFASCGSTDSDGIRSGQDLYLRYGCSSCHGATGAGGTLGPPLRESTKYWKPEALTDFLVDPTEALANDERLAKLNQAFRATNMRPFDELTREQLSQIADFVLSLK